MLATLSTMPVDEQAYAFEYKWDGVRAICYYDGAELRLESRNLLPITHRYPELWGLGRALKRRRVVLDGEVVALDRHGRPSFSLLQQRMHVEEARAGGRQVPIVYMIFDVLYLDGDNLMGRPYSTRRQILEAIHLPEGPWNTPPSYLGQGRALLAAASQSGLEGIVAKRVDSTYEPGRRTRDWLKIKVVQRQEFVIGGWTPGEGSHRGCIGSLLVGFYDPSPTRREPKPLHYAGSVGTGFKAEDHRRILEMLRSRQRKSSPFAEKTGKREAVYVEPELVAEVEFLEWTHGGVLRHPSFKGLRADKRPEEVVREEPRRGKEP